MKKWLLWMIIILVVLAIVAGIIYYNISGFGSGRNVLDFGNSEDLGQKLGKATDTNSFDDLKLNPFENE